MKHIFLLLFAFSILQVEGLRAQDSIQVVGYTFESNGRGYISDVKIVAKNDSEGDEQYGTSINTKSDKDGRFELHLKKGLVYQLRGSKTIFKDYIKTIDLRSGTDTLAGKPLFLSCAFDRLPGYLLEASISEFLADTDSVSGSAISLHGVTIEVYNNTTFKEELRLVDYKEHNFSILLEQGNEYLFMLRKEGYYTKRMKANVNVNGCILCLEGFGTVTPGVAESLTRNNTMGTLIANVTMKAFEVGKAVKMENLYYDYGSFSIRKESYSQLDELAQIMRDNPRITIELSSHTDCRGGREVNRSLSQQRAESVVAYIVNKARNSAKRIIAKGYGEDKPMNSCIDGVECTEELHQQNRRTEFMILEVIPDEALKNRSLASIMQEENLMKIVAANDQTNFEEDGKGRDTNVVERKASLPVAIPAGYTGFKLELLTELESPEAKHPVFLAFDLVYLDFTADSRISFLIGDYSSKAAAEAAKAKYIKSYPKIKVVEYKDGMRK